MKKKFVLLLTVVSLMGSGNAFAASPNIFSDVPAKHWSYDAINKLAQAGIVEGYGEGTFRGDRTISRYEMAIIVARAMTKMEKAHGKSRL